jgi:hypothetical protein
VEQEHLTLELCAAHDSLQRTAKQTEGHSSKNDGFMRSATRNSTLYGVAPKASNE